MKRSPSEIFFIALRLFQWIFEKCYNSEVIKINECLHAMQPMQLTILLKLLFLFEESNGSDNNSN